MLLLVKSSTTHKVVWIISWRSWLWAGNEPFCIFECLIWSSHPTLIVRQAAFFGPMFGDESRWRTSIARECAHARVIKLFFNVQPFVFDRRVINLHDIHLISQTDSYAWRNGCFCSSSVKVIVKDHRKVILSLDANYHIDEKCLISEITHFSLLIVHLRIQ